MKKITLLLLLCSTFIWAQDDIIVTVDVSEIPPGGVNIVTNYPSGFAEFGATDNMDGTFSYTLTAVPAGVVAEYVWKIYFTAGGDQQEAMAGKIGGTGVDNDVAVGQPFVTDFFSFANRTVTGGQTDPVATYYFDSFRQPSITYSEIVLTAATGNPYYLFYSENGFSAFGGPGATDNGDGTHTALVRPIIGFEYKWILNDNASNQVGDDTQEDLITCTNDGVQINTDNSTFANRIHAVGANESDLFNTCPPPLSVDEFNVLDVNIYPNPSQDKWNIKTNGQDITSVQVFDMLGKNVMSITPNSDSVQLDATTLPSGLYFARLTSESGTKSVKLIKQ